MKIFYKKIAKLITLLILLLSIYYLILYFKYNIKSNIYEITKPGEPKSYLVSGFHAMEKNDILPDRIKNKIPNIDLLITEIYLNESDKDYKIDI